MDKTILVVRISGSATTTRTVRHTMAETHGKRKDPVRSRILRPAKRLFAEQGFYNTDRTKIRTAAHVSEATISTRFEDEELAPKEMILVEILENGWTSINQLIEGFTYIVDPMDTLRRILSVVLDVFAEDKQFKNLFVAHSREVHKFGRRLMEGEVRKTVEMVESIFAKGQEKGIFRKDLTAKSMQRAFFGTIEEFLHSWVLHETSENYLTDTSRRELEKTIDSLLVGFSVVGEPSEVAGGSMSK